MRAHVVVRPSEAPTASFQSFSVGVPNEKELPTTEVKLIIPEDLQHITPTQKAGWQIAIEKQGSGEDAAVKSITWTGGSVAPELRDDFTFSAKTPAKTTQLRWKAYQTYADGTVVAWDKTPAKEHGKEGGNSGPFSVTSVAAQSSSDTALKDAKASADNARASAAMGTYTGIIGIALALLAVFFATRRKT